VRPFCEELPAAERGKGGGAAGSGRLQQRHSHFPRTIYVPPPLFFWILRMGNRAITVDALQSFGGTIWTYPCVDCARLLLKPTSGMADWRDWAQTCPSGSSPDLVARLPVVVCKRGAAALGLHSTGTSLGLCDRCCIRSKRAARRDLAPSLSATTLPPRSPTAGLPTPGVPLVPRLLPQLGQAPAPPSPLYASGRQARLCAVGRHPVG